MAVIDPYTDLGKRVLERLENEQTIWLTTVGASGAPHEKYAATYSVPIRVTLETLSGF